MPFQIALSGLNAASTSLNTTANNIANVNTTGFKSSRANFVELFATGLQNVQESATGLGARTSSIQQLFSQGSLEFTDNNLDLAMIGSGFFTLADDQGALSYTRAGNFSVDDEGDIVNDQGFKLQGFPPLTGASEDSFNTGQLVDLSINTTNAAPSATENIDVGLNLPSDASFPPGSRDPLDDTIINFDPEDGSTFNHTTSATVFDSLGKSRTATYYFVKDSENVADAGDPPVYEAVENSWTVYSTIDGELIRESYEDPDATPPTVDGDPITATITFNNQGAIDAITSSVATNSPTTNGQFSFFVEEDPGTVDEQGFPSGAAADLLLTSDFADVTQFGSSFNVNTLTQDGFASGRLASIQITEEGVVSARFTNGVSQPLGQLAITNFANPDGLENVSDTRWAESADSGQALRGAAGTGNLGEVQSGAIETANVDLAKELVNMITAQRTYQANAQMITTADQITQTVLNLR